MCAACAWIGQHIAEVSFGGCQLRRRWTCRRRIMATNEKESEGCRIERRCALISTLNICQKISMEQWSAAPFRSMSQLSSSFSVRFFSCFFFNSPLNWVEMTWELFLNVTSFSVGCGESEVPSHFSAIIAGWKMAAADSKLKHARLQIFACDSRFSLLI